MQLCSILLNIVGVPKGIGIDLASEIAGWYTRSRYVLTKRDTPLVIANKGRHGQTAQGAELEIRQINRCWKELVVQNGFALVWISEILPHLANGKDDIPGIEEMLDTRRHIWVVRFWFYALNRYGNENKAAIWRRTESCSSVGSVWRIVSVMICAPFIIQYKLERSTKLCYVEWKLLIGEFDNAVLHRFINTNWRIRRSCAVSIGRYEFKVFAELCYSDWTIHGFWAEWCY